MMQEHTSILKTLDELGDGRTLLADGDVHAVQLLDIIRGRVKALLVDDGIDGDGSLAGLTITNDQLTLATSNGYERVHGLQ